MQIAERVMVFLGIPCAVALWIDFGVSLWRRLRRRRVGSSPAGSDREGSEPAGPASPRTTAPRGGGDQ